MSSAPGTRSRGARTAPGPGPAAGFQRGWPRPIGARPRGRCEVSLWERVVEANRPGPPEHSLTFRGASVAAVVVAAGACYHEGELSSGCHRLHHRGHRGRQRRSPIDGASVRGRATKPILAICAVAGFVWFITTVTKTATPGDISTVEGPLAVLCSPGCSARTPSTCPARRDVAYSLGRLGRPHGRGRGSGRRPRLRHLGTGLVGLRPGLPRRHVAVDVDGAWSALAGCCRCRCGRRRGAHRSPHLGAPPTPAVDRTPLPLGR